MHLKVRYLIALSIVILAVAVGLLLDQAILLREIRVARDLRRIPSANLQKSVPVHMSGTVTYSDNLHGMLLLQDATGGVRLHLSDPSNWPSRGDRVAVNGSVAAGGVSPTVTVADWKRLGTGPLPESKPISFADARSGAFEYQQVSFEGVVRSVFIMERSGLLSLTIQNASGTIRARVHNYGNRDFRSLPDAYVRAEGVLASSLDVYGHPSNNALWISNLDSVHVLRPAPDVRSLPTTPIKAVADAPILNLHRVRLRGTLELGEGDQMTLVDHTGRMPLGSVPSTAKPGSRLDVAGFLTRVDGHVFLTENTVIAETSERPDARDAFQVHTAEALHHLPNAVAQYGYPVHLHGVITYFDPESQLLFVQDKTSGIFVSAQGKKMPPVASGDLVEISGVSAAGGFAPVVAKPAIVVVGKAPLPPPVGGDQEQIFSGKLDSQWVELPGVVRKAELHDNETILTLNLGQHTFKAHVIGRHPNLSSLLDAAVRLRGVCGSVSNAHKQLLGIQLFVPTWNQFRIVQAPPADPFTSPLTPLPTVLQYSPDNSGGHQIHVQGKVILSERSGPTWIADETGGLMIADHASIFLHPGDEVEAIGFPSKGVLSPILTAASIRRIGVSSLPQPTLVVADEATEGEYDNRYVAMEAKLVEVMNGPEESSLLLQSGTTNFYAHVKLTGLTQPAWEIDSILRVNGICAMDADYTTGYSRPRVFQLYASSPAAVELVRHAPILSRDLAVKVLSVAGLAIFLSGLWIVLLQKRVRQQTDTINQKLSQEAALKIEAQKASEAKTQFLANMSHEIRTPLNGIIGFTELTLSTPLSDEQKDNLTTVRSSAVSLLQIVNDVLDFSKVEAGKMELHAQPFSVRSFAETVARSVRPPGIGTVPIHVVVAPDVPHVIEGDEMRLRQIVLNLLGNAVKFTLQGEIRFEISELRHEGSRSQLEFVVADTGIGIPSEARGQIFDAFQQGDTSITRTYGGTGLGLAICKRITGIMGGNISIESEVGAGTTVRFRCEFDVPEQSRTNLPKTSEERSLRPLRILIAEDNPVNRRLIERVLERKGHKVSLAMNGFEAVEIFSQRTFDLILMDVQMPEMDGLEATRRIRQLPNGAEIPILAFTANAMESELQRYIETGMTGFLTKPFQLHDLMNALAMHTSAAAASADEQVTMA